MNSFEFFCSEGKVKRKASDKEQAKALIRSGFERLRITEDKFKPSDSEGKYLLEGSYDALRELADAELAVSGYKTDSHEAAISYLSRFKEITPKELTIFDHLRARRIGLKYYGETPSVSDAKLSLEFAKQFIKKLKLILDEQLEGNK